MSIPAVPEERSESCDRLLLLWEIGLEIPFWRNSLLGNLDRKVFCREEDRGQRRQRDIYSFELHIT